MTSPDFPDFDEIWSDLTIRNTTLDYNIFFSVWLRKLSIESFVIKYFAEVGLWCDNNIFQPRHDLYDFQFIVSDNTTPDLNGIPVEIQIT